MDDQNVDVSPDNAVHGGGGCTKANPWLADLAMRPRNHSQFSDDRVNNMDSDPSAIASSSTPTLSSQHNDSYSSGPDNSVGTPPQFKYSRDTLNVLLNSCSPPCEDPADDYGQMSCQIDGPCDTVRRLPSTGNIYLTSGEVPSLADMASKRGFRRLQLDTGTLDLTYLHVPLPEGIVSALFNPSPSSYIIMRRRSDGFVSATAMFVAAFPGATKKELATELDYIKSIPTTKLGNDPDRLWVHPEVALDLANDYCLRPYVEALLDPADIPSPKTSDDGSSQPIAAPPRYSPTAAAMQPDPTIPVDHASIQMIGDGSPILPDGSLVTRLFDHKMSPKHNRVPGHLLISYKPNKRFCYLQGINPVTGILEPDFGSLVVTIEGVVYEKQGGEKQAGGIVFCDNTRPWFNLTYLDSRFPQTKEQALLEALSRALTLTKLLRVALPHLREVRILTSSTQLCQIFCLGMNVLTERNAAAAEEWLRNTDMSFWKNIDMRWKDITEGRTGRPVDVRLWYVTEGTVAKANETAIAEMYRSGGRDLYEEHGKGHDPLKYGYSNGAPGSNTNDLHRGINRAAAAENAIRQTLDQTIFMPPKSIINKGNEALSKWEFESKLKFKQALLYVSVAAEGIQDIDNTQRTTSQDSCGFHRQDQVEARSREIALERAYQAAGVYCHKFLAENPVVLQSRAVGNCQEGDAMDVDVAIDKWAQAVAEMVMMDEDLD